MTSSTTFIVSRPAKPAIARTVAVMVVASRETAFSTRPFGTSMSRSRSHSAKSAAASTNWRWYTVILRESSQMPRGRTKPTTYTHTAAMRTIVIATAALGGTFHETRRS